MRELALFTGMKRPIERKDDIKHAGEQLSHPVLHPDRVVAHAGEFDLAAI